MDEAEAIRRARVGDREGFRWLVERDGDLVRRTACLLVRDRDTAEDLAQEAFLAAWQGIGGLRTPTGFRPWAMRILLNKIGSHRRRRRHLTLPFDALPAETEPADARPGPPEEAFRREQARELAAAMRALREEWRQPLVLRYYAELSVAEIAGVLELPEGTVKSRLHRALEALRSALNTPEACELPQGGEGR
jgi:RNA polymerase sigma-70 factor (ECF subfamily)